MTIFKKVTIIVLIISVLLISNPSIYAHELVLDIEYDPCAISLDETSEIVSDGENEMWYFIEHDGFEQDHISHTITTIKYYFDDVYDESSNLVYSWTTDIYKYYISQGLSHSEATSQAAIIAEEIKDAFVASMEKWNNIYYYSYDENGNRVAHKIINIIEGTQNDHNLTIYPMDCIEGGNDFAKIISGDICEDNRVEPDDLYHTHYSNYVINVNVHYFYEHSSWVLDGHTIPSNPLYKVQICKSRTGQHEIGHLLGLRDMDDCCVAMNGTDHHEEVLMGYGNFLPDRSTYAKYKDIAGVSITRGFHTDDDHMWMLRNNWNGTKDVICALCNGVRYDITLSNGQYEGQTPKLYESCTHHNGTNEQMLLVATDGERDFYKCMYCRHIEETTHVHRYTEWEKHNSSLHIEKCLCGAIGTKTSLHAIRSTEVIGNTAPCIGCGCIVRIDPLGPPTQIIKNVQKVSVNGSYILPNGIIVLVDEDVEAYMNGTLVFYDKDKVPELQ